MEESYCYSIKSTKTFNYMDHKYLFHPLLDHTEVRTLQHFEIYCNYSDTLSNRK